MINPSTAPLLFIVVHFRVPQSQPTVAERPILVSRIRHSFLGIDDLN
jgi:hypothetical protein